ncbi:conserved hypothetical protein [Ricinus communis]|uniref:Uncharacterized protein n=1 Tax=Ricinus communis TaxID=3988 RepID=B9RVD9_RICCO|nr:conserved hypothetical protein [Ricinus communis]
MPVYNMIYGSNTSSFGWDSSKRKVVIAKPKNHKKVAPFMTRSLWHFEEFNIIYGKDRAIGKDTYGLEDIPEEIQVMEDVDEGNNEIEIIHETSERYGDTSITRTHGDNYRTDNASSKKKET